MSELTAQPIGLYPEDRERIKRIAAKNPDLKGNVSKIVRFALQDVDERLAAAEKRQKPAPSVEESPATVASLVDRVLTDERARLQAAVGERSLREVDRLAEVARGTANLVIRGNTRLDVAGGGRLLEWVKSVEASKA